MLLLKSLIIKKKLIKMFDFKIGIKKKKNQKIRKVFFLRHNFCLYINIIRKSFKKINGNFVFIDFID